MIIGLGAEIVQDQRVVRVITFLLSGQLPTRNHFLNAHKRTTMQSNPDELPLLRCSESKLIHPIACVHIILAISMENKVRAEKLTSLVMRTTKTERRTSVFIPCFLAISNNASSSSAPCLTSLFFCIVRAPCSNSLSTSGLPDHPAPTSHHFPFLSADRRSFRDTLSGSDASTTCQLRWTMQDPLTSSFAPQSSQEFLHSLRRRARLFHSIDSLAFTILHVDQSLHHESSSSSGISLFAPIA